MPQSGLSKSQFRERLGVYLLGVAIGLMLLGIASLSWKMRRRPPPPSAPPPAAPAPAMPAPASPSGPAPAP